MPVSDRLRIKRKKGFKKKPAHAMRDAKVKSPRKRPKRPNLSSTEELPLDVEEFIEMYLGHRFKGNKLKMAEYLDVPYQQVKNWCKHPKVLAEIESRRAKIRAKGQYTLELAMEEAEAARVFAEDTGNANAYVKAVEHKAKLNGLLVEKYDHRMMANFSIQIDGVKGPPMLPTVAADVKRVDEPKAQEEAVDLLQGLTETEKELFE